MKTTCRSSLVILATILSLGLTSVACGLQRPITPTMAPTPTIRQEATVTPAPTPTPRPTDTPEPTATPEPTPRPGLRLGGKRIVKAGGFSFHTIAGFNTTIQETSATIGSEDDEIILGLGAAPPTDPITMEEALDGFLDAISQDIEDLEAGEPGPVTIDGVEGLAVDITGVLFGDEIAGRVAVVAPSDTLVFFAFGFAVIGPENDRWEDEGAEVFDMVVGSVRFFEPVADTGPCPIASDATYGYTEENPIRVGGGVWNGPARERAYLDTLRGPEGQPITYQRLGSTGGEVILDIYEVSYEGLVKPIILYIDMYNYEEPQAPAGLTCASPFPLEAP